MDTPILTSTDDGVWDSVADALEGAGSDLVDALPRAAAAVAILVIGVLVGRVVRHLLRRALRDDHTESFRTVFSKIGGWLVVALAILLAATVAFPSVKPVDILAGAGLFSIAIGFAFKDIFENLLAGMLLLFRQPFESGDQVEVKDAEGTVQRVTIRETRVMTYDGQLKIIPNSDVYKNVIRVQTAEERRRMEFLVGVAYEDDLDLARDTIREALAGVADIADDPAPEALISELAASTINIRARFWCASAQKDALHTLDSAIYEVKTALDEAGVQLPCDIVTIQGTSSLQAALSGRELTPSGSERDPGASGASPRSDDD